MSHRGRNALAEFLGTGLLVAAIVGSGIAPSSAPAFIVAELLGGALGAACVVVLFARTARGAGEPVDPRGEAA